jgi:hypothetical protein
VNIGISTMPSTSRPACHQWQVLQPLHDLATLLFQLALVCFLPSLASSCKVFRMPLRWAEVMASNMLVVPQPGWLPATVTQHKRRQQLQTNSRRPFFIGYFSSWVALFSSASSSFDSSSSIVKSKKQKKLPSLTDTLLWHTMVAVGDGVSFVCLGWQGIS